MNRFEEQGASKIRDHFGYIESLKLKIETSPAQAS